MMGKFIDMLHEFQDFLSTTFSQMKGISGDLGEIRVVLKRDKKLIK